MNSLTPADFAKIAVSEILKTVPVVSNIISAHSAVFGELEKRRVQAVLDAITQEIAGLRLQLSEVRQNRANEVLLRVLDVARSDLETEQKARHYGSAALALACSDESLENVNEVLESLRKLSAFDLKILYKFRENGRVRAEVSVAEIGGFKLHPTQPMTTEKEWMPIMLQLHPSILRLEALGVCVLDAGANYHEERHAGRLRQAAAKVLYLTQVGTRLVRVLPT